MLCRSQFFHHIFSSWGYFSKVSCNPEPLSPQFQAAFFISNSLPNFSRASISMESIIKGPFVPGCAGVFSSWSHLKTLALWMLYSVWSSSACPCLAASETRSTGTPWVGEWPWTVNSPWVLGRDCAEPGWLCSLWEGQGWYLESFWWGEMGPARWFAIVWRVRDVASHFSALLAI